MDFRFNLHETFYMPTDNLARAAQYLFFSNNYYFRNHRLVLTPNKVKEREIFSMSWSCMACSVIFKSIV